MPRTIEHIVAIHELARERSNAGKPIWDQRIDIKAILFRDKNTTSPAHAAAVAAEIAALIRVSVPKPWLDITSDGFDRTLDDIVEGLEFVGPEDDDALECLNGWLGDLYDWADLKRVWLGGP